MCSRGVIVKVIIILCLNLLVSRARLELASFSQSLQIYLITLLSQYFGSKLSLQSLYIEYVGVRMSFKNKGLQPQGKKFLKP